LDAPSCSCRQLPGRARRAIDDRRDLVKRDAEHVVEHERQAFRGREGLQDDEQSQTDGIGDKNFVLRIAALAFHDRFRQPVAELAFPSVPAAPQHVEADTADDRREPGLQIRDPGGVATVEP
jgi:hypothetical protein